MGAALRGEHDGALSTVGDLITDEISPINPYPVFALAGKWAH